MVKKLRKAKKPVKMRAVEPMYRMRFGTRNELGDTRKYISIPAAKKAVVGELKQLRVWCERHNRAGLAAIDEALTATDSMVFHRAPARLEVMFDEHYGMWFVAEYWNEE